MFHSIISFILHLYSISGLFNLSRVFQNQVSTNSPKFPDHPTSPHDQVILVGGGEDWGWDGY